MVRFNMTFTIWGNSMKVTVFADTLAEALLMLERRYVFFDEGSLSVTEEKEDGRQNPVVNR